SPNEAGPSHDDVRGDKRKNPDEDRINSAEEDHGALELAVIECRRGEACASGGEAAAGERQGPDGSTAWPRFRRRLRLGRRDHWIRHATLPLCRDLLDSADAIRPRGMLFGATGATLPTPATVDTRRRPGPEPSRGLPSE